MAQTMKLSERNVQDHKKKWPWHIHCLNDGIVRRKHGLNADNKRVDMPGYHSPCPFLNLKLPCGTLPIRVSSSRLRFLNSEVNLDPDLAFLSREHPLSCIGSGAYVSPFPPFSIVASNVTVRSMLASCSPSSPSSMKSFAGSAWKAPLKFRIHLLYGRESRDRGGLSMAPNPGTSCQPNQGPAFKLEREEM